MYIMNKYEHSYYPGNTKCLNIISWHTYVRKVLAWSTFDTQGMWGAGERQRSGRENEIERLRGSAAGEPAEKAAKSIMMTSSNGNIFRVTAHCAENSPVPVNSPHKGQWRGALMFSLICVWINDWVNNGDAGDLRRYRIHYDVTVM